MSNPESHNPYLAARAEWLERYGGYIKRAAQWRLAALVALSALLISVTGNLIQAGQHKVVPYLVQVDSQGRSVSLGRAEAARPTPKILIQAELAELIINWRTVTADQDLQKRMINRLSNFISGSAQGLMTEWFEKNNPYQTAANGRLVQVAVKGLPLPVSQDSWRVEWTETLRNHAGTFLEANTYEATIKITFRPPANEAQIMANPGGIMVTELSYTKVLSAGPAGQKEVDL